MAVHKLRGLEYLVAVVEAGGFNAAARQLGVAAPSVHRLVKALETELAQPLIDRSARPLQPTAAAAAYVARARMLLSEMRELDASLRDRVDSPRGTVSLAVDAVALKCVVPALLPGFHRQHPEIQLDIHEAGAERDLGKLGTDMMLQFGWPPPQDAALRTLADTRWLVVATPAYWSRHGQPARPEDLARHPCALFRTPFGEVLREWIFSRAGERVSVVVDGWLVSESRQVLDAPVLAGQMVARVNDLTLGRSLADGGLQPVLLDWEGQSSPPLNLVIRRSVLRQPRVRACLDALVAHAQALTAPRLPAGLPPVGPAQRPDWWRRRVPTEAARRRR